MSARCLQPGCQPCLRRPHALACQVTGAQYGSPYKPPASRSAPSADAAVGQGSQENVRNPKVQQVLSAVTPANAEHLLNRRTALTAGLLTSFWAGQFKPARAVLKSVTSDHQAVLNFNNTLQSTARIYWLNFDGDAEFFAALEPGGFFTVDTYESHPWRIINASNGAVVQEYVAKAGDQQLIISESDTERTSAGPAGPSGRAAASDAAIGSFDGIGGHEADYALAQLDAVSINMDGGMASLHVEGYPQSVVLFVGVAEAAALLYATGMESRRPSTVGVWQKTLEAAGAGVKRILVTRLVGHTFYARILLELPGGAERSVDARPSDSLALALACSAPVFVARQVASHQTAAPLEQLLQDPHSQQLGPEPHSDYQESAQGKSGLDA